MKYIEKEIIRRINELIRRQHHHRGRRNEKIHYRAQCVS